MKTINLTCSLFFFIVLMMIPSYGDNKLENQHAASKGPIPNRINAIKKQDAYLFNLWKQYKNSSGIQRSIDDALTNIIYLDTRIDMLGFLLFGPKNYKSVLDDVRDENHLPLVDDQPCLLSTMDLFEEHCGGELNELMTRSLANICNSVVEKKAIEEAILAVCPIHATKTHVIDVRNPKLDFTPAPIHGTSKYCGRVSIDGISRMRYQSYATTYKATLDSSQLITEIYDNLIQVCFHKNDSLGLCECEDGEWRSLQRRSWSSTMSPYEKRIVDVMFRVQLSEHVTITLEEVSPGWRYLLLGIGITLPLGYILFTRPIFPRWAMGVLAAICIFMSSVDTTLGLVAVLSYTAMCYVIYYRLA